MYFLCFNSSWLARIRNMVTATLHVCRYTNLGFIWYKPESIIVRKLDKNKSYQGNLLINLTPFLGSILTYYLSYWLEIVFPFPWLCMPIFFLKSVKANIAFLQKIKLYFYPKCGWIYINVFIITNNAFIFTKVTFVDNFKAEHFLFGSSPVVLY